MREMHLSKHSGTTQLRRVKNTTLLLSSFPPLQKTLSTKRLSASYICWSNTTRSWARSSSRRTRNLATKTRIEHPRPQVQKHLKYRTAMLNPLVYRVPLAVLPANSPHPLLAT